MRWTTRLVLSFVIIGLETVIVVRLWNLAHWFMDNAETDIAIILGFLFYCVVVVLAGATIFWNFKVFPLFLRPTKRKTAEEREEK